MQRFVPRLRSCQLQLVRWWRSCLLEKGSLCSSFSLSLSPSLPVTRQPFNVECQGDGDVTLPAGWRPLHRTRVQRQRKALSDCAPLGARLPRVSTHPHFLRCWGHSAPIQALILPLTPRRGSSAISSRQCRDLRSALPESRPLDSRTRLDASPPSALGRWAGSHAPKDIKGLPGTAQTRRS